MLKLLRKPQPEIVIGRVELRTRGPSHPPRVEEDFLDAQLGDDVRMGADPAGSGRDLAKEFVQPKAVAPVLERVDPNEHAIHLQELARTSSCVSSSYTAGSAAMPSAASSSKIRWKREFCGSPVRAPRGRRARGWRPFPMTVGTCRSLSGLRHQPRQASLEGGTQRDGLKTERRARSPDLEAFLAPRRSPAQGVVLRLPAQVLPAAHAYSVSAPPGWKL